MDTDRTRSILSRGRAEGASDAARLRRMKVEQQIADATIALLAEGRAFADLSVGEIATRAGIARSAFYNHYADKRELIIRLAERHSTRVAEHMAALPVGELITPREQVTAMLRVAASAYTREPHLARALFEAASYDDVVRSWWNRHVDEMVAAGRSQLEFEQRRGRLGGIDVGVAAYALHWLIHETFNQELVQHQRFDPEVVIETVAALILRAIGTESG
jgi:AcrR family transcriptional regulator